MSMFDTGLLHGDYPEERIEFIILYDRGGLENVRETFISVEDATKRFIRLSLFDDDVTMLELIQVD